MIRICVQDLVGATVEPVVITILPEQLAISVWLSKSEQRQSGDCEGELDAEEHDHGLRGPPFTCKNHIGGIFAMRMSFRRVALWLGDKIKPSLSQVVVLKISQQFKQSRKWHKNET